MPYELIHHGGRYTVTGSCHELRAGEAGILVDCGLLQGEDAESGQTSILTNGIRALIVTHVHIDHVGRIPWLVDAGFRGPIYCSRASAKLLPLVIEDAVKVGVTRDRRVIEETVETIQRLTVALDWNQWHELDLGADTQAGSMSVRIRLQRAGHILGSAYVEVGVREPGRREERIVFSGDLGAPHAPLIPAPKPPYRADTLVLESTYGDRLHPDRSHRRAALREVLKHALRDEGVVLVPAFSLGRTQELLYEIEGIIHEAGGRPATGSGLAWSDLEIIVDSPLAARFTEVFKEVAPLWDDEARRRVRAGRHPLSFEQLYTIGSHESHLKAIDFYRESGRAAVVVAASGMCTGGRIVNWLKAMIGDARNDVVFVGYQASGTPGRQIQEYGPRGGYVVLDGERHTIRAGIHRLGSYSAHADQAGLLRFASGMRVPPRHIRLVHGEEEPQRALAENLRQAIPGVQVD